VLAVVYFSDTRGAYECPRYVSVLFFFHKYTLGPYYIYGIVLAIYYYTDDIIIKPQIDRDYTRRLA
jgi:hypothetical protein